MYSASATLNAAIVINVTTITVDDTVEASQNVNSLNSYMVLKDFAQENAMSVNIENSILSQVTNGSNVHVNSLLPSSLSGGSLNNLHQTNIITVTTMPIN